MTTIKCRERDDYFVLVFEYEREIIQTIKTVPSMGRNWDKFTKEWHVYGSFFEDLKKALEALDYEVVVTKDDPAPTGGKDWAEMLFERVGAQAEPVFRALVRVLHSDEELMEELTNAWDLYRD